MLRPQLADIARTFVLQKNAADPHLRPDRLARRFVGVTAKRPGQAAQEALEVVGLLMRREDAEAVLVGAG
jgi:hypothetical protein